ncbi:MAG: hypothetical protein IPP12_15650 [Nitrospira sp.]|nr:hypothetical protein [Nitrospira sp.]
MWCHASSSPARFPETGRDAAKTTMGVFMRHQSFTAQFGVHMPLDIEKYRHHLDGCDISEEDKTALIQNLWVILEGFVDHAFGRHPIQQCGTAAQHSDLHKPARSLESADNHPLKRKKPIRYEDLKRIGPP